MAALRLGGVGVDFESRCCFGVECEIIRLLSPPRWGRKLSCGAYDAVRLEVVDNADVVFVQEEESLGHIAVGRHCGVAVELLHYALCSGRKRERERREREGEREWEG